LAASSKKSFDSSAMSHNAEIKLCHLYQFAEAFSGIASVEFVLAPQHRTSCDPEITTKEDLDY